MRILAIIWFLYSAFPATLQNASYFVQIFVFEILVSFAYHYSPVITIIIAAIKVMAAVIAAITVITTVVTAVASIMVTARKSLGFDCNPVNR